MGAPTWRMAARSSVAVRAPSAALATASTQSSRGERGPGDAASSATSLFANRRGAAGPGGTRWDPSVTEALAPATPLVPRLRALLAWAWAWAALSTDRPAPLSVAPKATDRPPLVVPPCTSPPLEDSAPSPAPMPGCEEAALRLDVGLAARPSPALPHRGPCPASPAASAEARGRARKGRVPPRMPSTLLWLRETSGGPSRAGETEVGGAAGARRLARVARGWARGGCGCGCAAAGETGGRPGPLRESWGWLGKDGTGAAGPRAGAKVAASAAALGWPETSFSAKLLASNPTVRHLRGERGWGWSGRTWVGGYDGLDGVS